MIKINLAKRKGSGGAAPGSPMPDVGEKLGRISKFQLDFGQFQNYYEAARELPLKRVGAVLLIAILSQYMLSSYEEEEINKMDASIKKYQADQAKLKGDLEKTKGFEQIKKSLDGDELTIKTKIEVIQKLILDRQKPPKLLLALSSLLPQEVWLSGLDLDPNELKLQGQSMGFIPVSDFIHSLGESADFTDVKLVRSDSTKDDTGVEVTRFELVARRR